MEIKGIDVSKWQGEIDWEKVARSGVKFAMIRATYGTSGIDSYFYKNAREAKEAGIDVGAYHYSYAVSVEEAIDEARNFLDVIKKRKITYPTVLDLEDKRQIGLSKEKLTKITLAFLETLKEAGYFPMLYVSLYWWKTYLENSRLKEYNIWIAEYSKKKPNLPRDIGMWQHTNNGIIDGITGRVDLDIAYKDYASIIQEGGWNGLEKENMTVEEAKKIVQEKCGFDNNTMLFLSMYRYGESLLTRLAEQMI